MLFIIRKLDLLVANRTLSLIGSVLNNIQDVMVEVLDTIPRNRSSHLLKVWFGLDACEIISKSLYYSVQYQLNDTKYVGLYRH